MITIEIPTFEHIEEIQKLNSKYLFTHLSNAEKNNGFIKIEYNAESLKQIIYNQEIVIATKKGKTIGYYLIGRKSGEAALDYQKLKAIELFQTHNIKFDKIGYGCQVCIQEEYRNNGISRLMMEELKKKINHKYDYLLSSISTDNKVSLQNSTKIGWQVIDKLEKPTFYLYKIL